MKCTSSSIEKAHNWKRHKSAEVGKCIGVPEENNLNISGLTKALGTHVNIASIL